MRRFGSEESTLRGERFACEWKKGLEGLRGPQRAYAFGLGRMNPVLISVFVWFLARLMISSAFS